MNIRILSVGQCGVDEPRVYHALRRNLGATVTSADTADQARRTAAAGAYDLILVNRVLQDGSSGLDLLSELSGLAGGTPVMLVSDHPDAQEEAVARGAVCGFGKSQLGSPETMEKLRRACAGAYS